MKIIKKETAYEGKFLRVVNKVSVTDDNLQVIWETVERTNIFKEGIVAVIALTKDNEFVLERQWRAAIERHIIQLPAGLMDDRNESSEETARRELQEETGYKASKLVPVMTAPTNPVLSPLTALYYFAPEVEYVGGENRDAGEEMEIITVPKDSIGAFLLDLPADTEIDLRVPGIIRIVEAKGLL
jgi:ADP-ribose pyrophosphatase